MLLNGNRTVFRLFQKAWRTFRTAYGIEVEGTPQNLSKKFFISSGSWYGNNTIWRMVYDLNKIVRFATREGKMEDGHPQRDYIAILDGVTAGEGNGPLEPLPVEGHTLIASDNPFQLDMVMAKSMGFDYRKIPCLANHRQFSDADWGQFDPEAVVVGHGGGTYNGIEEVPVIKKFLPPPGWRGHIELAEDQNIPAEQS
jgi:hypothetical protein